MRIGLGTHVKTDRPAIDRKFGTGWACFDRSQLSDPVRTHLHPAGNGLGLGYGGNKQAQEKNNGCPHAATMPQKSNAGEKAQIALRRVALPDQAPVTGAQLP